MRPSIAVVAAAALLAAGCGGSHSPQRGAQSGAVAYSACMRSHGVPAFPDPTSAQQVPKVTPQQAGVGSAALTAAQTACLHLLPNGGRPTEAEVARYRSAMLVYARCMRAHGVSNMPDPDSRGHLDIGPGTDVDIDSPAFQAAFAVCKSKLSP